MTLRHPAEVAASLAKRDGMSEAEAGLIWLRNMLDAEHDSRGLRRVVIGYDQLMSAPTATMAASQKALGLIWPRLSDKVSKEIDAFMSPHLRHQKVEASDAFPSGQVFRDWLSLTYGIFLRWSESGEDAADHAALDRVRLAMDALAAPLGEVILTLTRQATDIAALDKEVRYLRGEAGKSGDTVAALTAEKKTLTGEKDALFEALAQAKAAQAEIEAKVAALQAQIEAERDMAASQRAEVESARDTALSDLASLQSAHEKQTEEVRYLRGEAGKRGEAVAALTAEKKTLTEALATARAEAEAAQAQAESQTAVLEEEARQRQASAEAKAMAMAAALRADIAGLTGRLQASEAHQQGEAQRLAEEMADLIGQNLAQAEQLTLSAAQYREQEQVYMVQIADLQRDLEAHGADLAETKAARQSLQDSLSETQSALRQRQHEAEETATALKAAQKDIEAAQAELEQLRNAQAKDQAALDAARRDAKAAENARYDEITELTQILIKRDAAIAAQAARIHAVNASYADLNNQAEHLKAAQKQAQLTAEKLTNDLKAREAALASLMAEVTQRGAAIGHLMHLAEEGQSLTQRIGHAIDAILSLAERPWLRGNRKLARKAALLNASGLFDAKWYGQAYPDVVESKQDPASHFILFGRAEGRHPLPDLARFLANMPKPDASPAATET